MSQIIFVPPAKSLQFFHNRGGEVPVYVDHDRNKGIVMIPQVEGYVFLHLFEEYHQSIIPRRFSGMDMVAICGSTLLEHKFWHPSELLDWITENLQNSVVAQMPGKSGTWKFGFSCPGDLDKFNEWFSSKVREHKIAIHKSVVTQAVAWEKENLKKDREWFINGGSGDSHIYVQDEAESVLVRMRWGSVTADD